MKKIIVTLLLILLMIVVTGCDVAGKAHTVDTAIDFNRFDRAIIKLPNGDIVEGNIQGWCCYESAALVKVQIDNVMYYTHMSNVVLINE